MFPVEEKKRADRSKSRPGEPGAARLYALVAGALLCLLGVAGFFYDASFHTGSTLSSDYLAGTLLINGWRNVLYIASGMIALGFAARAPRITAYALGGFYLALAIWGFVETNRGIGDILGLLPLGDRDNAFHLIVGLLGVTAGLVDGPRPRVKLPKRKKRARKRAKPVPKLKTESKAKVEPKAKQKGGRPRPTPTSSSASSSASSSSSESRSRRRSE